MNRTLLLPLSACLLFASCVTTYSTSRKYVAVDTPEGETVVMNGDTLRYGLTPRDMALELGVEPSGKNLARMSRIVYAANSPQTAYGFYDATPEPLSLGIGMFEDRGNNNRYEHPDLYWTGDGYRTFRKNDWTLGVRPRYRSVLKATERRGGRRATRYANSFQKGRVNVSLAFPWLQLYSFSPVSTGIRRNNGGCIGIAAGIEYLYRDKRGIALETSALAGYATIWGPAASIDPPPNRLTPVSERTTWAIRASTTGTGRQASWWPPTSTSRPKSCSEPPIVPPSSNSALQDRGDTNTAPRWT